MPPVGKSRLLKLWENMPETPDSELVRQMAPFPRGKRGPKFGECGIRIEGSEEFIKAVLGRLKPLLLYESSLTRLETSIMDIHETRFENGRRICGPVRQGTNCLYLRYHERSERASKIAQRNEVLVQRAEELLDLLENAQDSIMDPKSRNERRKQIVRLLQEQETQRIMEKRRHRQAILKKRRRYVKIR